MNGLYQNTTTSLYHISVGAVLFNDKMEVCVHHFFEEQVPEKLRFLLGGLKEGHHLMRETLEDGETLEDAVTRGLHEEFGARGVIEKYLGAQTCIVGTPTREFEKVTLYHAVRLEELGERPNVDEESRSKMEWYSPSALLALYERQRSLTTRPELDESVIVERFMKAYGL